jgi:hypothetical protein
MKVWMVYITGGEAENAVVRVHASERGATATAERLNREHREKYNVRHGRYAVDDIELED